MGDMGCRVRRAGNKPHHVNLPPNGSPTHSTPLMDEFMKSGTRMAVRSEPSVVRRNGLRSCPWSHVEDHVYALAKVPPRWYSENIRLREFWSHTVAEREAKWINKLKERPLSPH